MGKASPPHVITESIIDNSAREIFVIAGFIKGHFSNGSEWESKSKECLDDGLKETIDYFRKVVCEGSQ